MTIIRDRARAHVWFTNVVYQFKLNLCLLRSITYENSLSFHCYLSHCSLFFLFDNFVFSHTITTQIDIQTHTHTLNFSLSLSLSFVFQYLFGFFVRSHCWSVSLSLYSFHLVYLFCRNNSISGQMNQMMISGCSDKSALKLTQCVWISLQYLYRSSQV